MVKITIPRCINHFISIEVTQMEKRDRFFPTGMTGAKKVAKFFKDENTLPMKKRHNGCFALAMISCGLLVSD